MLLGFKQQFEHKIRSGEKTHTIRGERKDGKTPAVGEALHCYVNPRTKQMRLIGRWPCVRVEPVRISLTLDHAYAKSLRIQIGDQVLSRDEADAFAKRDGFENMDEMARFWKREHGLKIGSRPWRGWVIHWDFTKPLYRRGKAVGAARP